MKRIIPFLACLSAFLIFSCNSDDELTPQGNCVSQFLTKFSMLEYDGAPIPCEKSFLVLYENDFAKFAVLQNICIELPPQLILDCDGNEICTFETEEGCVELVENSIRIGIIGVAE